MSMRFVCYNTSTGSAAKQVALCLLFVGAVSTPCGKHGSIVAARAFALLGEMLYIRLFNWGCEYRLCDGLDPDSSTRLRFGPS